jgi:hypothetical protein
MINLAYKIAAIVFRCTDDCESGHSTDIKFLALARTDAMFADCLSLLFGEGIKRLKRESIMSLIKDADVIKQENSYRYVIAI